MPQVSNLSWFISSSKFFLVLFIMLVLISFMQFNSMIFSSIQKKIMFEFVLYWLLNFTLFFC